MKKRVAFKVFDGAAWDGDGPWRRSTWLEARRINNRLRRRALRRFIRSTPTMRRDHQPAWERVIRV